MYVVGAMRGREIDNRVTDNGVDYFYEEMKKVEKSILDHYTEYMEEYDPMADGLFDSWNWDTKEVDFTLCCTQI